jgi:hypothetical protein
VGVVSVSEDEWVQKNSDYGTCPLCGRAVQFWEEGDYYLAERCPAGCYWTDFRCDQVQMHRGPAPEVIA